MYRTYLAPSDAAASVFNIVRGLWEFAQVCELFVALSETWGGPGLSVRPPLPMVFQRCGHATRKSSSRDKARSLHPTPSCSPLVPMPTTYQT